MTLADIDLRAQLADKVHYQGNRPLCAAFAMSLVHEAERTRSGEPAESLAPEALWSHAHGRGLTTKDGTSIFAIADALENQGQPPLSLWPINTALAEQTEPAPHAAGVPPWLRGQARLFNLARDGVEAELEATLADGRPALIVVEVTNEFYFPPGTGVVVTNAMSASLGRHAIACVGAATISGQRHFLIQNSWGSGWGAGGYGWLDHGYLSAFGGESAALSALL